METMHNPVRSTLPSMFLRCSWFLLLLLLNLYPATAQTVTGGVTGTITDPTDAVVAGAHVTAKNVDTGVTTESTTNESGVYTIRFLPAGTYTVTIDTPGFSSQTVSPFALEINATVKINAKLAVGANNTNVDVQSAVPILNTNDSQLSTTFTANEIGNIPLNGRNFSQVMEFMPGAVVTSPTGMTGTNGTLRNTNQRQPASGEYLQSGRRSN
jgi:Carboxypeptidase regulatory-like domain